ncbi:3214_t:CDS:2 [Gigaspora margarita]|uniref:3214_t:CDS:1 n=1 Tax=Gigaspora margarita TaxID=4874 RepID=A0ABM8VX63_GIGMA|nr:3214_t:CDS:2 [Gigaspora margarita]
MGAMFDLFDKITRLYSLLLAIKIAFLYAIINSIISAIITVLYMLTDIKLSFKQDFITLVKFIRVNIDNKEEKEYYISILLYFVITIKDYLLIDKIRDAGIEIDIDKTDEIGDADVKVDIFSGLEQIDESIPFVYSTLLSLTTWIYSLSLSFQLVSDLQWLTVPIVFLTTLFLFGIIELAKQLEDPFGIDINDLDLYKFCKEVWKDTKFIITDGDEKEYIRNEVIENIIWEFKKSTGPKNCINLLSISIGDIKIQLWDHTELISK